MSEKAVDLHNMPPFADLLARVAAGEEIVFEEYGRPIARLAPIAEPGDRVPGLREGQGWMSEDFDGSLPDQFWTGEDP